ncbi:MAG: hypothetical protein KME60_15485 [Cyanomargarita calcarea GSE-NOS-MK-12-04C]|jgi:hypothetical protein|uniref:Uncharacterized protein n=1 Tax=Cyanomargarita calcarea GSE-NOS-MK-12-04C TaxID=2839659 RepID=A0A951QPJ5_9CYAN|nr:hypothetical protein [Cyanomargarita calcarea GSE-NOS-MK-12-04C]
MKISQETSERLVIVEQDNSVSRYLSSLGWSIILLPFALSFLTIPGIIILAGVALILSLQTPPGQIAVR